MWQARDAYYSGDPLIVDDMFDRVEVCCTYKFIAISLTCFHFRNLCANLTIDWKTAEAKMVWIEMRCEIPSLQSEATVNLCRC